MTKVELKTLQFPNDENVYFIPESIMDGVISVASGNFLIGNGSEPMIEKTPDEIMNIIRAVPTARKINNKALSTDITLSAADVDAVPVARKINNKTLSTDITLSASDVGALNLMSIANDHSNVIPTGADLNNYIKCDVYRCPSEVTKSLTNAPTKYKGSGFRLIVSDTSSASVNELSGGLIQIIIFDTKSNKIFFRVRADDGVWGNWDEFATISVIKLSPYPIGSIYISTDSTSPASLFGGSWTQITDRFLLAAGSTYTAGSTGGSATHTLTEVEMPNHTHQFNDYWTIEAASSTGRQAVKFNNSDHYAESGGLSTSSSGGGQAHNNMPPYLTVYMWKRIA